MYKQKKFIKPHESKPHKKHTSSSNGEINFRS